jgi:transcriptional regulator with XRE-family HTH domain
MARAVATEPPISEEAVALGKLLREARGSASLREVQERCGAKPGGKAAVSINTLWLLEKGRRAVSPELLDRIVLAVGADAGEAFRLAGLLPPKAAAEVLGPEVSHALSGPGLSDQARNALRRIHLAHLAEAFSGDVTEPPVPVGDLLHAKLAIDHEPAEEVGWARFTSTNTIGYAAMFEEPGRAADRSFMLAHMAGHGLIAQESGRTPHCSHEAGGRREAEATWLAGVILMPRGLLEDRFHLLRTYHDVERDDDGLDNLLGELANDFAVPRWLAMRHAGDAGLLAWAHLEEDL